MKTQTTRKTPGTPSRGCIRKAASQANHLRIPSQSTAHLLPIKLPSATSFALSFLRLLIAFIDKRLNPIENLATARFKLKPVDAGFVISQLRKLKPEKSAGLDNQFATTVA